MSKPINIVQKLTKYSSKMSELLESSPKYSSNTTENTYVKRVENVRNMKTFLWQPDYDYVDISKQ